MNKSYLRINNKPQIQNHENRSLTNGSTASTFKTAENRNPKRGPAKYRGKSIPKWRGFVKKIQQESTQNQQEQ